MQVDHRSWFIFGMLTVAVMGIVGYVPGLELLASVRHNYIPMAPNTAVCFILLGFVLLIFNTSIQLRPVFLLLMSTFVALYGLLEFLGYFIGIDFTFENTYLLLKGVLDGVPIARMSPATGGVFFLSGTAVAIILLQRAYLMKARVLRWSSTGLGLIVLLISFVFFLAYLYGTPLLYKQGNLIPMALTTAIGFIFLATYILIYETKLLPLKELAGAINRNYLLRYMLPLTVVSVILGGVAVFYSIEVSEIFSVYISAILTILMIIVTAYIATLISSNISHEFEKSEQEVIFTNNALLNSETRWRTLVDILPDFVWLKDPDGTYLFCNRKVEQLFGLKESEIIGKTDYELVDNELADLFRQQDKIAIETNQFAVNEEELKFPDDRIVIVETIKTPMFTEDGQLLGVLGIARDITERKENEIRYRNIFTQTYQFSGIVSLDGILISANQTSLDFIGVNETEVINKYFWDTPWWRHSEELIEWLKKGITQAAQGEIVRHEVTHISKQGTLHYFDFSLKLVTDEKGEPLYLVPESRDITERKQAEEALKIIELEQREILNFMIDSVISIDEKGNILTFNKAAETLFGYTAEEIIGKPIKRLMPGNFAPQHDEYVQHYLDTGEKKVIGSSREVQGLHKNNDVFPMRLSVAELPVNENGKRRFIGSCHDLSEHKQQEEIIRRSQKMDALGKLTSGIAHDYNNTLGVVLGYSELLQDALKNQPKLAKYAQSIHHAGERGAKLTHKLLAFSRHIASDADLLNINKLLKEEQLILEKTLTARIKLIFDLQEDLWPVWMDEGDLEDALLNISINAMHAMEAGGKLTIQTRNHQLNSSEAVSLRIDEGDYVVLSLEDTGCGMDEETYSKIFDPFFSTKGNMGTGLGLSQVYGFVERSDGVINVYSEPAKGTRFDLYFPRYQQIKSKFKPAEPLTRQNYNGSETVLVVDDEESLLSLSKVMLSEYGYKVLCAENAEKALEILEAESVELLFSDIIMPDMDGYELAAIVQEKYPLIEVLLTSGIKNEFLDNARDDMLQQNILPKPFSAEELTKRIRKLLDD